MHRFKTTPSSTSKQQARNRSSSSSRSQNSISAPKSAEKLSKPTTSTFVNNNAIVDMAGKASTGSNFEGPKSRKPKSNVTNNQQQKQTSTNNNGKEATKSGAQTNSVVFPRLFTKTFPMPVSQQRYPSNISRSMVSLEHSRNFRTFIEKAMNDYEIFSCCGVYLAIRNALKKRGWVEKPGPLAFSRSTNTTLSPKIANNENGNTLKPSKSNGNTTGIVEEASSRDVSEVNCNKLLMANNTALQRRVETLENRLEAVEALLFSLNNDTQFYHPTTETQYVDMEVVRDTSDPDNADSEHRARSPSKRVRLNDQVICCGVSDPVEEDVDENIGSSFNNDAQFYHPTTSKTQLVDMEVQVVQDISGTDNTDFESDDNKSEDQTASETSLATTGKSVSMHNLKVVRDAFGAGSYSASLIESSVMPQKILKKKRARSSSKHRVRMSDQVMCCGISDSVEEDADENTCSRSSQTNIVPRKSSIRTAPSKHVLSVQVRKEDDRNEAEQKTEFQQLKQAVSTHDASCALLEEVDLLTAKSFNDMISGSLDVVKSVISLFTSEQPEKPVDANANVELEKSQEE